VLSRFADLRCRFIQLLALSPARRRRGPGDPRAAPPAHGAAPAVACRANLSVVVAGRLVAARADQEVDVDAAVGLEHMVDVEPGVAAYGGPGAAATAGGGGRAPRRRPPSAAFARGAIASGPRTSPASSKVESASHPEGRDNHPKRSILSIVGDVPHPSWGTSKAMIARCNSAVQRPSRLRSSARRMSPSTWSRQAGPGDQGHGGGLQAVGTA
jgi:hypothetical protein